VLLTALQLALLVLVGSIEHVQARGVVFVLLLLVGLARRSWFAWVVLVLLDGVPLLAILAVAGGGSGHTLWGNVAVMVLTGIALEATLFAPAMRKHITGRQRGGATRLPALR